MATVARKFDFVVNVRGQAVLNNGKENVEKNLRTIFGASAGKIMFVEGKDIKPTMRRWVMDHAGQGATNSVVIVGGDGSVEAAAEEVMGSDITLGILPGGTHNLIARQLGFNADLWEAAKQYRHVAEHDVDVGKVNGTPFLFGMFMDKASYSYYTGREAVRDGKLISSVFKFASMASGAMLEKEQKLRITGRGLPANGVEQSGRVFAVTINALTPRAANGEKNVKRIIENAFAKDTMDSGELAFYAFKGGLVSAATVMPKLFDGTWDGHKDVTVMKGPNFYVDNVKGKSKEVSVIIDGEPRTMQFPLKVTLDPKALRTFKPVP